nr:1,2-phenylacetyl-CoA epoxidase subunit PaaD [Hazenella coriacea]
MASTQSVEKWFHCLNDVKDPEIPTVSIVEMGMVHQIFSESHRLVVEVIPTFMGCPALDLIEKNIKERLQQETGVEQVEVRFVYDPPWTSDRITEQGRIQLREFGIAPPAEPHPSCPYCDHSQGEVISLFGPTACRSVYYCRSCRQPFEAMKIV